MGKQCPCPISYGMKKDIHPKYYPEAEVKCACGNQFKICSTLEELSVEICSQCHPFYTGQEKIIDSAGRVEKFKAKRAAAKEAPKKKAKSPKKSSKESSSEQKEKSHS